MPYIQARATYTSGSGKAYTRESNSLNVNKIVSELPNNLRSDKLLVMVGSMNTTRFYFVAGDKLLVEKTVTTYTQTSSTSVVTKTGVINVTKTGWLLLSDLAPAGFKESEIGGSNLFSCRYFIEPVEYTGDRYYATSGSLDRISSINFCKRLIFAASDLAPAGIKDQYVSMYLWGETNPDTGVTALVIPKTMDDLSGLFDNAATLGPFTNDAGMPKIITLGKIKKMHRTFYNAFSYGMFTYSPPVGDVVFGEMDVSEVTDFSYCFGQCFQANPDIENWNVSSATNMTGMFGIVVDWTTDRWTRNLSNWCVSKITSEPANFALNHPMSAAQKPVWGACPIFAGDGKLVYWIRDLQGGNFQYYYGEITLSNIQLSIKGGKYTYSTIFIQDDHGIYEYVEFTGTNPLDLGVTQIKIKIVASNGAVYTQSYQWLSINSNGVYSWRTTGQGNLRLFAGNNKNLQAKVYFEFI